MIKWDKLCVCVCLRVFVSLVVRCCCCIKENKNSAKAKSKSCWKKEQSSNGFRQWAKEGGKILNQKCECELLVAWKDEFLSYEGAKQAEKCLLAQLVNHNCSGAAATAVALKLRQRKKKEKKRKKEKCVKVVIWFSFLDWRQHAHTHTLQLKNFKINSANYCWIVLCAVAVFYFGIQSAASAAAVWKSESHLETDRSLKNVERERERVDKHTHTVCVCGCGAVNRRQWKKEGPKRRRKLNPLTSREKKVVRGREEENSL